MNELSLTLKGMNEVNESLKRLKIPLEKRKWVHGTLARKIRVFSRARIRGQHDLEGAPWSPRKVKEFDRKTRKQRMLMGLGQRMRARADSEKGVVDWIGGKVAGYHQHGGEESWDAAKAARIYGVAKYSAPATSSQALRLLALGYKVRKGGRLVRPSKRHIMSSLSMGQAGLLIKLLRGDSSKKHWSIKVPSRPFLGVTDKEDKELLLLAAKTIVGITT